MQHWWWAARGSTVSRQIREYKRKDKGQGQGPGERVPGKDICTLVFESRCGRRVCLEMNKTYLKETT